jgi:hypothetical protein
LRSGLSGPAVCAAGLAALCASCAGETAVTGDLVLGAVLIIAVLAALAVFARFEWLVIISFFATTLSDSQYEPDGIHYTYLRFVPLGLVAVRVLIAYAVRGSSRLALPRTLLGPFGIFFLFALASTAWALDVEMTALRAVTLGFVLVGFGIGLPVFLGDDRTLRRATERVVLLVAALALLGLLSYPFLSHTVLQYEPTRGLEVSRVRGFFKNPNTLGILAMLSFAPLLAWWREARRRRWTLGVLAVTVLVTLILTGSRASMLGVVASVLVYFLVYSRDLRSLGLALAGLTVALGVVMQVPSVASGILRTDDGLRFELWRRAFDLGMRAPLVGQGFGSTDNIFLADKPYLASMGVFSAGSHNEYLRLFVAVGGVGVLMVLYGFGNLLLQAVRWLRRQPHSALTVGVLGAVVGSLVNAVFEDGLFAVGGAPAIPFWFYVALIAVLVQRAQQRARRPQRTEPVAARPMMLPAAARGRR